MKIINLLGGPGCGKSTTASGLFYYMKSAGMKVELVREYVKDAVYESRNIFDDQMYIFAKQNRRQHILVNSVDWIITDSPLILSAVYAPVNYFPSFSNLCLEAFRSYDNINFFISREKPYSPIGRNQTEEEAKAIDISIKTFMKENNIDYHSVRGSKDSPKFIMKNLEYYYGMEAFPEI